jgi:hypothetical protein
LCEKSRQAGVPHMVRWVFSSRTLPLARMVRLWTCVSSTGVWPG